MSPELSSASLPRSFNHLLWPFALVALALFIPAIGTAQEPCPPASPVTPASRLLYLGPGSAEFSDPLVARARLVDETAQPLAGRMLAFSLAGESQSAATNSDGVATATLNVSAAPGSAPLAVAFAGDASHPATQTTTTITIDRDETSLIYTGSPFFATGNVALSARLTHGDGDHAPLPVANRPIEFQLGLHTATGVTDANGVAAAVVNLTDAEVGPLQLTVRFAGDSYYRESQDARSGLAYQRNSFVIWGGNAIRPTVGQTVNFWGHSWSNQVTGGDYDSNAEFKGHATVITSSELCQVDARLSIAPQLTAGCWDSKPGQAPPPTTVARYISAIVSTAIGKSQDVIYGNIAAVVIIDVSPDPQYGPDPGKPGYGTIVAVIGDGANLFARPTLSAVQEQPQSLLPGQLFSVGLTLTNSGAAAASALIIQASFSEAMPETALAEAASLAPSQSRTFAFEERVSFAATARGASESVDAYLSRLAGQDGRLITSQTWTRFSDVSGAYFSPILGVASSRLQLPIVTIRVSGVSCATPGTVLPYTIELTNLGGAAAASGRVAVTFPDGTTGELQVPSLAAGASTVLNVSWTVPTIAPQATGETDTAYRARLASFDAKILPFSASLTWSDAAGNSFGASSAQFQTIERLPILILSSQTLPSTVLPNEPITPTYTIQNLGTGVASSVVLRVKHPDGQEHTLSPLSIPAGQTTTANAPTFTVPAVPVRAADETEAVYRQRLVAVDGKNLAFDARLDWADSLNNPYGPASHQSSTTEIVPILAITMTAPAEALSGDPITYSIVIANSGRAAAAGLDLAVTMPDGTVQRPAISPLAAGSTTNLTLTYTIPENQPQGEISANASLRWNDARNNLYGELSNRATTLAKPKNLPPVVEAGATQIAALPSLQFDTKPTLRAIATGFNNPIGIDYHQASNKVLMSVNYPSGFPYNLELVSGDGSRSRFSSVSGLTEELKVATARDDGGGRSMGGFPVGEAFTGSGVGGVIVRISADGTTVRNPWVRLPNEFGLMRGSLHVDRTGIYGGDLIVVTTTGGVWRVTEAGGATRLANLGVHLEGLITLPNNPAKYGPWAGKIVAGAEAQRRFYTIDPQGTVTPYELGIEPEDLDIIAPNENFFGVDFSGRILWGANASGFRNLVGDLLVAQEFPGILWHLRWDGMQFVKTELARVSQWEHVTFAPVGIGNIKPPGATVNLNGTVTDDGRPVGAAVTVAWSKVSGPGDVIFGNAASTSTTATFFQSGDYLLRLTASDTMLTGKDEVTITIDPSNQPPVANAGPNQSIRLPGVASLNGSATDDGFPRGSTLTYQWTKLIGPGSVSFANATQAVTTASFSTFGTYVLRLTVRDGDLFGSDDVVVSVSPENIAPVVSAGVDQTITLPTAAQLQGQVTDDGKPVGGQLTFAWTQLSGPGVASFSNPNSLSTSVSFTVPGAFVLRLSANDSQFGSADDVAITALPGPSLALSPSTAGPNVVQTFQTIQALLTSGGAAVAGASVQFTVTGPNARSQTITTDAAGKASLSYTGTQNGTDTIQASAQVGATQVVSNTATVGWISPVHPVSTSTVLGRFFTADGTGVFNTPPTAQPIFNQSFPTITFNPPAGTIPGNTSPVGVNTRPFTDVTTDLNGNFTGTIAAQGNGQQAGLRLLGNFNVVFTGTIVVRSPGAVTFSLTNDDGFIFGIGNGATRVSGVLVNPPASMKTPFSGFTVMGSHNFATAPITNSIVVNFPTAGPYPYELDYSDGRGDALVMTMNTVVGGVSRPLPSTGALTITPNSFPVQTVGVPVSVMVSASDASGQPLPNLAVTLSITGANPRQLNGVTDTTGKATFTYTGTNAGGDTLQANASFTGMTGYSNVVLIQRGSNRAPTVDAGPDQTVVITNSAVLIATITDDGLPLGTLPSVSWSMVIGPTGVLFSVQGRAETTARFSQPGTYVLRVSANDTILTGSDDVIITVIDSVPGNSPPQVNAGPDQTITAPSAALLNGIVTDDGAPIGGGLAISWSKVSGPGTVAFADPTRASTFATFSVAGTYVLRLTASDTQLTSNDELRIIVNPGNQAPVVNAGTDQTVSTNPATLSGSATDDGQPNGTLTVSWAKLSGPGTITFATPTALTTTASFSTAGTYVIRLTASDSQLSSFDDVTVVFAPVIGPPPVVAITAPADGADVTAPTSVMASIDKGSWRLEYALQTGDGTNNSGWTTLATGTAPTSGTVAQIDPTLLLNGVYALRLTATDSSSQSSAVANTFVVSRALKIGPFTLSFPDLNVPVAGIPMQVTRTYDSRDKRVGDFGVGWNLDLKNVRVQKSDVLGKNWEETLTSGFLPRYCIERRKPHIVTITFPDGRVYKFQTKTSPDCQQVDSIRFATIIFTQLTTTAAASGATLTVSDPEVFVTGSIPGDIELNETENLEPFNPSEFTLTTRDGSVYVIDQLLGLRRMTDASGNTLTVSANGIVHSGGKSITFTRDSLGRIARITDPAGNALVYSYDAAGDLVTFEDREHAVSTYSYDSNHGLLTIHDPNGRMPVRNDYDSSGRLIRTTDASGNVINYTHNTSANQEIVTDRLGNTTVLEYDAEGNVVRKTDALGGVISYTFDAAGNKLTETNPLGHTSTSTYDALGNVLTMTDPLGNVKRNTYDAKGRHITSTDPLGNVTTNTYDAAGNLLRTEDPLHNITTYTYDSRGLRLSETNPAGCTSTYQYDGNGNVTQETNSLGHITTYTYDGNGNRLTETGTRTTSAGTETLLTSYQYDHENRLVKTTYPDGSFKEDHHDGAGQHILEIDELGHRTEFEYSAAGDLTVKRFADGLSETRTYDAEGHLTVMTDRAGRPTTYAYDKLERIASITKPDGAIIRNGYDAVGRLIEATDGRGNKTSYAYDAAGRNTSITDALSGVTRFTYDLAGNKTSMTDPNGNTTSYAYDAAGRLVKTTFPDSTFKSTTFDFLGRKTAETDQAGAVTRFEYDCMGRLVKVTDALGQLTTFGFDEVGNRTSQTDAEGRRTLFEYDKRGRMTRRTLPLGQFETRSYDAAGNLTGSADFNGVPTTYSYDTLNRLTQERFVDGSTVSFAYTASGKPSTVTDARGATTYTYDAADRELSINQPGVGMMRYTYDPAGNRTSVMTPAGTTSYAFDALNRLSTVTSPTDGVTNYSYDPMGNRTQLRAANGTVTTYSYDRLNRLTQLVNARSGGAVISSFTYTLGPAGNRTRTVEGSGRTVDYTYDAVYRLLSEAVSDPTSGNALTSWTYDKVGNRLTENRNGVMKTYSYDANDRMLSDGVATYTYDANGSLTARSSGVDSTTYQYDVAARLKRITNSGSSSSTVDYEYDAAGNRMRKTVNGTDVTNYLVDTTVENAEVLLESSGAGATRASYVRGDDLLSMQRGPVQSFYLYDGHMNTRQLTDAAQNVTDTYTFDAFGNLVAKTGSTENDFLYTSEQFDANAGFYYLRARYYDPASGRFISRDNVDGSPFEPASLHKYAYAHNDPVNRIDPSGHFSLIETQTTIQIMQTISQIFPTLLRGYLIYKGVDIFYRPGFAMRNYGVEMYSFCASTRCFEAAHKLVESGNRLIIAGSHMIAWADKTVGQVEAVQGLLKTGYGFYELVQAIRHAPTGIRAIWLRYEYAARLDYLEFDGRSLLQITATVQIKQVYLYMQRWTDYSEAIGKALRLLDKIRKIPSQIGKVVDLVTFSEGDIGL